MLSDLFIFGISYCLIFSLFLPHLLSCLVCMHTNIYIFDLYAVHLMCIHEGLLL